MRNSNSNRSGTSPLAHQSTDIHERSLAHGVVSEDTHIERGEVLRQLFGDVGEHVDDFTCAVQSNIILHGRMYVTDRFLCFYSNLFGLEKKIRIPYSHITVITKENTAFVIPNAIAITTYRKEYLFRSFWDRDEVVFFFFLFLSFILFYSFFPFIILLVFVFFFSFICLNNVLSLSLHHIVL